MRILMSGGQQQGKRDGGERERSFQAEGIAYAKAQKCKKQKHDIALRNNKQFIEMLKQDASGAKSKDETEA